MVATPHEAHTYPSIGLDATIPMSGATLRSLPRHPSAPILRIEPGARVGDYIVEELRSRGGFGTVYRASHVRSRAQVALKVLHSDLAVAPDMVRRFECEATTLNRIRHPNIVRVFDVGTLDDGRPFFAMEWLDGHTLSDAIRRNGPFDLPEMQPIVEDLCGALAAAHEVGIIHRDLKASNVMVVPTGDWFTVKLFDFGIAKLLNPDEGDSGLTSTGNRLGTPHHMAPEQILGGQVDRRTDVYALGVLMHQLLTGQFPFDGENPIEIEEMHLRTPPPRVSELAPVSSELDDLVFRCLAKRREDRYDNVTQVIADVRAAAGTTGEHVAHWAQELRPSLRLRATKVPAIGIHVDVRLTCDEDDADDDLLDRLDDLLYEIRAELRSHGLDIAEENANALLAVSPLPAKATAADGLRRQAVERALSMSFRVAAETDSRIAVAFAVHVAPALVIGSEGRREYIGGELMHLSRWIPMDHHRGVVASDAALDDIASAFATEPTDDEDFRAVIAAVS